MIRNTQVKYKSSSTRSSNVISKVKRFREEDKNNMPPIFDLGDIKRRKMALHFGVRNHAIPRSPTPKHFHLD